MSRAFDESWNDSLHGDFIWSNVNVGEAVAEVMTPLAWSILCTSFAEVSPLPGYNLIGNIGGRPYNNLSVMVTMLRLLRLDVQDVAHEIGGSHARSEQWIDQAVIPIPRSAFFAVVRNVLKAQWKQWQALRNAPAFMAGNAKWCKDRRAQAQRIQTPAALAELWSGEIAAYAMNAFWMVIASALQYSRHVGRLRRDLTHLVGRADADALLSNVSRGGQRLASLGPVVGIWEVFRGTLSREAFLEQYGHRGPYESKLLSPEVVDPARWLDQQLEAFAQTPVDVEALLAGQRAEFAAAWERFRNRYPRQSASMERRLQRAAGAARLREAVRSELVRISWVSRACAIQAGKLSGVGDGIFFLTYAEILDVLRGIPGDAAGRIAARQAAYQRYKALPPYPPVIRGRFDPLQWAADPARRSDVYDAHRSSVEPSQSESADNRVVGAPGSAGRAEGLVRRLERVEEGESLVAGEILVTYQTHIGWTPIFPRAAAIVTDVGAPLSHAAIVARELGIPAVVGCGNATQRLKTGDRVRVDGASGVVEILQTGDPSTAARIENAKAKPA